jgi:hypothetical protein
MARYALRAFGSPVFLSNMVVPKRYALRVFGSPVLLPQPPLPDANVTVYTRSGDSATYTRSGDIAVYDR